MEVSGRLCNTRLLPRTNFLFFYISFSFLSCEMVFATRSLLSFRALTRPSRLVPCHARRCFPQGIRHLSDDKPSLEQSQPTEDAQPQAETDIPLQTVPLEQLKAKEAEVADLTVSLRLCFCGLCQPSAQCRPRKRTTTRLRHLAFCRRSPSSRRRPFPCSQVCPCALSK
ncbi:hypothetical protein PISMIDRAFT_136682 [Pisolithus microcarpus 441]|uniref:Uncharacterized protein n=1 Tax=Pisolithus microcarpus 441 TaxID=765257 RepID=A0A0D0AAA4_9AGAM|nr:hypothetical protein PISMIDRAFT_136682 [Pisolithus microcarpus 441]